MTLSLSDLEAFVQTCLQGSYTRAAESLFISQPALHHKVRRLEAHLGVPLLEVRNRQMVPTAAGRSMLSRAQALLRDAQQLERAASNDADDGSVRVGATSLLASGALISALAEFRITHPKNRVKIRSVDFESVFAALVENRVEFAITYAEYVPRGVIAEELPGSPIVCAASPSHPLIDGRQHDIRELLTYPLALTYSGMALRTKVEAWFKEHLGVTELSVLVEAETAALLATVVSHSGEFIMFMARPEVEQFKLSEVLVDTAPMANTSAICYLPTKSFDRPALDLLRTLRAIAGVETLGPTPSPSGW